MKKACSRAENSSRTPSLFQFWTQSTIQIENSTLEESGGTVLLIMQIMKRSNKVLCCLTTINKILKLGRQKYLILWLYRGLPTWPTTHMQANQKHLLVLWKNVEVQTSPVTYRDLHWGLHKNCFVLKSDSVRILFQKYNQFKQRC